MHSCAQYSYTVVAAACCISLVSYAISELTLCLVAQRASTAHFVLPADMHPVNPVQAVVIAAPSSSCADWLNQSVLGAADS